jgi:ArsR family transcriptional regulator, virulence genes transcriptional regulator
MLKNEENIMDKSVEIAAIFSHFAHQKRLLILCHLMQGKHSVGDLASLCQMGQSQTSQCLKRMELEGLLKSEREGNFIYYELLDMRLGALMKNIKEIFC